MTNTRRYLLRGMLGALGLAAVMGAGAVVLPLEGTWTWRLAATALIVGVAAGVMLGVAGWLDKAPTRPAGLLAMGVCILEVLSACALLWLPSTWGRWFDEFLGQSIGWTAVAGIVGTAGLRLSARSGWRTAGVGVAIAAGAAWVVQEAGTVLAAGATWGSTQQRLGEQVWASGGLLGCAGILGALASRGWRDTRDGLRKAAWIGIVAAAAGLVFGIYGVWSEGGKWAWWPVGLYMIALVGAYAQIALGEEKAADGLGVRWTRMAGLIACGVMGALVTGGVTPDSWSSGDDTVWRMAAGAGMVWVSSGLALVVMARLGRKERVELGREAFASVRVVCPRCGTGGDVPVGEEGALCGGCKLHVSVRVHSAACGGCGYDLKDLKADRCPECGAVVA